MQLPNDVRALCFAVEWPPEEPTVDGATEEQIKSAEDTLGIIMPREFRCFLAFLNGPCIGPGGLFGVETRSPRSDIRAILGRYPEWKAEDWIPVAGDGCGNYYVLVATSENGQPVCFIDTMSSSRDLAYVVASNFWQFLRFLLGKELGEKRWPFDQDFVTSQDPAIRTSTVATLPWDE